MMCGCPNWQALHTYSFFKSNFNVNEGLEAFSVERIKVGEKEAGTIIFYLKYNTFLAKKDKKVERQLLYMVQK